MQHVELATSASSDFVSARVVFSQPHRPDDRPGPSFELPWTPSYVATPDRAVFRWRDLDLPTELRAASFDLHSPASRFLSVAADLSRDAQSPSVHMHLSMDLDLMQVLTPEHAWASPTGSPLDAPSSTALLLLTTAAGAFAVPIGAVAPPAPPTPEPESEQISNNTDLGQEPPRQATKADAGTAAAAAAHVARSSARPPRSAQSSPRGGPRPGVTDSPTPSSSASCQPPPPPPLAQAPGSRPSRHSRNRSLTQILGDAIFGPKDDTPAAAPPPPLEPPAPAARRLLDLRRAKEVRLRDMARELQRIAEARRRLASLATERLGLRSAIDARMAPPCADSAEALAEQVAAARARLNQLGHDRAEIRARMAVAKSRSAALRRTLATEAQGLGAGLSALRDARDRLREAQAGLHGPGGLGLLREAEGALLHRQLQMLTTLGAIFALRAVPGTPDPVLQSTAQLGHVDRLWWGARPPPSASLSPNPRSVRRPASPLPPPPQGLRFAPRPSPLRSPLAPPAALPGALAAWPLPPATAPPSLPPTPSPPEEDAEAALEELPLQCSIAAVPVEDWALLEDGRPKLDRLDAEADDRLNAALGLMCLLTLLAAKYLGLPLAHPMVFRGSASFVVDGRADRRAPAADVAQSQGRGLDLARRSLVRGPGGPTAGGAAPLSPYAWPASPGDAPELGAGPGSGSGGAHPNAGSARGGVAVVVAPLEHSPRQPSTALLLRAISLLHANVTQVVTAVGLLPRGPRSNPAVVLECLCVLAGAAQIALVSEARPTAGPNAPAAGHHVKAQNSNGPEPRGADTAAHLQTSASAGNGNGTGAAQGSTNAFRSPNSDSYAY